MKAWYERAFGEHYLKLYAHRDQREARRVLELVFPGSSIGGLLVADIACGAGRYLPAVRNKGARVVGFDLSEELLAEARSKIPRAQLVRCDMRRLPLRNESVDWALSLFTSFGYFETKEEHLALMGELSRVSRVGVVVDVPNPGSLEAKLVEESQREAGGYRVSERRHLQEDPRRVVKDVVLTRKDTGESVEYQERVMLFSDSEMLDMAAGCGLRVDHRWGSYDGSVYRPGESPRQILRLKKAGGGA